MASNPSRPKLPSQASLPPGGPAFDTDWDDDTLPNLELDDPMSESAFDRVTAIPELPAEVFARRVMDQQQPSRPRKRAESSGVLPELPREPPEPATGARDPSLPPPASDQWPAHQAPSTVPSPELPTARPSPISTSPASLTGLELADLIDELPGRTWPPPIRTAEPRDPWLELDLGEELRQSSVPAGPVAEPPSAPNAGLGQLKDRYAMGDFSGALIVAEAMLEENPLDEDARRYAENCRDTLTQMYSARLGSLKCRVSVAVPGEQIRWLSLDHRAGFVLSLIDGSSSLEELLDISGMARLDALRILFTLYDQRVIALGDG